MSIETLIPLWWYSDWANAAIVAAAAELPDEPLDRNLEIGPGTLRRIIRHIGDGELVWLSRWKGNVETPWPSQTGRPTVAELGERFVRVAAERDEFIAGVTPEQLQRVQSYRDSRGSLFRATLGDMLLQGIVHSIHHRAQAVNALRRVGGKVVEVDYMMRIREPA